MSDKMREAKRKHKAIECPECEGKGCVECDGVNHRSPQSCAPTPTKDLILKTPGGTLTPFGFALKQLEEANRQAESMQEPVIIGIFRKSNKAMVGFAATDQYIELDVSEYAAPLYTTPPSTKALKNKLREFANELTKNQQPLGEEFEKILRDNLWDLYES